jgi:hypothetical protein
MHTLEQARRAVGDLPSSGSLPGCGAAAAALVGARRLPSELLPDSPMMAGPQGAAQASVFSSVSLTTPAPSGAALAVHALTRCSWHGFPWCCVSFEGV